MTHPVAKDARAIRAVYGMFFLSGTGALVFENVWFNQTGLIVGNSVWSAALVVGAFMAGLAVGNGVAVVLARRWGNLVLGYGKLELAAALAGALLVLAFPRLTTLFRPLLAPFLDQAVPLNLIRSAIAFSLMALPAAALGATLPLLSKPLETATGNYGLALGRLYGVNTLGAVGGTLLAELVFIPGLGLRSSGLIAAACNLSAALIAFRIARNPMFDASRCVGTPGVARFANQGRRIVVAAFLSGGILLALEVIWFRFLLLFLGGTTLIFAMMLAVVLAGIGLGGMLASTWSRRGWSPGRVARLAAAGAALGVVAGYAGFDAVWVMLAGVHGDSMLPPVLLSIFLMGPVSLLSGVLFTALGDQLRIPAGDAAAATGVLALANTLGAMAGSLLAAFVLLPGWGLERSFFVLALLYGVTVLIIPVRGEPWPWRIAPVLAATLILGVFPFGTMVQTHYHRVEDRFAARLVAAREGIAETAFYLVHEFLGEPLYYRLATNAISMSSTSIVAQRYMKLFVYLPAAFHPGIERALLVCFGVGSTASALIDLPEIKAIDVVDVSRDILEMSDIAHPDARRHPLRDGRVSVHVEDARFFLQQTDRRYDLITGEPPPLKMAGIASLYSREYFHLLRERLNPRGLVTYWLPVYQLNESDTLAIVRAFCDVFEDCSLWSGAGMDWMLMGSRDGMRPVSRESFSRLWALPDAGRELRRIGIDGPEMMVATFMADASVLRQVTARALALVDNFPRRVSSQLVSSRKRVEPLYAWLMRAGRGREWLENSAWIAEVLPRPLIAQSGDHYRWREILEAALYPELRGPDYSFWSDLAESVRRTDAGILPGWLLDSVPRNAEIAARRGRADPVAAEHLEIDALANRRMPDERIEKRDFVALTPLGQVVTIFRHCLAGQHSRARSLMAWVPGERRSKEPFLSFSAWAVTACEAR